MIGFLEYLESRGRLWRRWIAAGIVIGAAHLGGGALALMQWPDEDAEAEPEGAFLIELAPMAVSPKDEPLSLPIGPRSEDVAETPPPVEEIKEKQPDEIPPVEESPAPNPEVAFQKQEPLKEIEEKKPQEAVAQQSASVAAAPPPIETAAVAPRAAAPLQGSSRKPSTAEVSWQKSLHVHLNKNKKYPSVARDKGLQGVVTVKFMLDRGGKLLSSEVTKSSGSEMLDAEALAALERSSPFPPPPDEYPDEKPLFTLPIKFNIK